MSLWKIAWRNMRQRALASCLTGVSMALGVALVVTVLVIHSVVDRFFRQSSQGYDMIVGANKGGRLQLVLNTVYHLSQPVENLPYTYYKEFLKHGDHAGRFASMVDVAVPLCLGDSYEEFRVVGTTPEMFEVWAPYQKYEFAEGRNFEHENFFEAVIGSVVAHTTGLKLGQTFQPTHGVEATEGAHKHDAFTVVGILKPTGTPNDRALFINMEGFYLLRGHAKEEEEEGHRRTPEGASGEHAEHAHEHDEHEMPPGSEAEHGHDEHAHEKENAEKSNAEHGDADHDKMPAHDEHAHDEHAHDEHEHAEHGAAGHAEHEYGADDHHHHHDHSPLPESQREVTAILVRSAVGNPLAGMTLRRMINKGNEAQAVLPAMEINTLLDMIVGNLRTLLLALSVLIVIVAGIGIMVSIYNSMSDRRRDIAVMRALGARRSTVFNVILLESILISLGGGVAGLLLGHGLIAAASPWVLAYTGFAMSGAQFSLAELCLIPLLIAAASFFGYLPALAAYRTDVAKALSAAP